MPFANTHIAEDTPMAIPLLEKAPQFDPGYAAAHGLMAWCYHFRYSRGGLREADRQSAPQQRRKSGHRRTSEKGATSEHGANPRH